MNLLDALSQFKAVRRKGEERRIYKADVLNIGASDPVLLDNVPHKIAPTLVSQTGAYASAGWLPNYWDLMATDWEEAG
jgi:hypothetical protein